jgi:hypothetical protein
LALALSLPEAAWAQTLEVVGAVTRSRGVATAERGSEVRSLATGAAVHLGDALVTGNASRLEVRLRDDTILTLGDGTRLLIEEFLLADGGGGGREVFAIVAGVFRAISGSIAKSGDMTVRTPLANIGIRGTDFWGEQRADRLALAMIEGVAVVVENAAGSVTLTAPRTITIVTSPDVAPSVPVALSDAELAAALATVAF